MICEHRDPRHEHAAGGQVDQPPKHGQGVLRQAHEGQEHEGREQEDAHVGDTPRGGAQEDPGGLPLQRETVQDPGPGEQGLVRRRPGRGDDDGVDHRRDTLEARGARGDDEGTLGGGPRLVVQPGVVARHEHADDEDG